MFQNDTGSCDFSFHGTWGQLPVLLHSLPASLRRMPASFSQGLHLRKRMRKAGFDDRPETSVRSSSCVFGLQGGSPLLNSRSDHLSRLMLQRDWSQAVLYAMTSMACVCGFGLRAHGHARKRRLSHILCRVVRVPRMGLGGAKFRTWSGPGGSSHKGPLTSALAYSGHFCVVCREAATVRALDGSNAHGHGRRVSSHLEFPACLDYCELAA